VAGAGCVAPLAPLLGVVAFWLVLARSAAVVRRGAGGCAFRFFCWRAGLVVLVALRFCFLGARCGGAGARAWLSRCGFFWRAPRAGGAGAWLLRCVFFLGARRGRALRVLGGRACFFFGARRGRAVRVLGGRVRLFSWRVRRAAAALPSAARGGAACSPGGAASAFWGRLESM